jgi:pimeloyl-ACP methyl ester carboxylesterase
MQGAGLMGVHLFARHACKAAARSFAWPSAILSFANVIDNPWSVARDRSEKAANILAEDIATAQHGKRPITLIGFSLGARLIFHALEHLAKMGDSSKGLIDHVLLMGGAFSADADRWEKVRNIVAGRLINAYCPKDWVLGYMYRTAELEFENIAGLHPVHVPGVENVNVSRLVKGHTSYQAAKENILRYVRLDDNC